MVEFSGHIRLQAARRPDGRTILSNQSFRAPFHLSKPYWDVEAGTLLVQVVNPTAGVLSGDRLEARFAVGEKAAMLVTTPSATRVFTMREGVANCRQQFTVSKGGWLEVAPEPLVPHTGSRFRQFTEIDVADGGGLFFVEQLLPGRIGFGEAWGWAELRLGVQVRIAGELVLRERLDQSGPDLRHLGIFAGSGENACFASSVLIPPEDNAAPQWRTRVAALHQEGTWIGVTAMRRRGWTIKIVATDPIRLRSALGAVREILAAQIGPLTCSLRRF